MKKPWVYYALSGLCLLAGLGCGKGSGSEPAAVAASLGFSGTLSTSATTASIQGTNKKPDNISSAVNLADLKFYAACFSSPPVVKEGTVDADGKFSVSMDVAKGVPCSLLFKDSDGQESGTVLFEDTTKKDMKGNAKRSNSMVFTDNVSLGAITLGTDGKVVVPVTQVAASVATAAPSSGVAFDPTGTWYMKAFDGTIPSGYQTVTAGGNDGPSINFPVTFIRFAGKEFTTTAANCTSPAQPAVCAVTDGTVGTTDAYGLSIWGGTFSQGLGACGSKLGFSADDVRAYGRIHVTSLPTVAGNTVSFGDYVYSTPTGFGGDAAPYNKPWMKTGATARYNVQDCQAKAVGAYKGWACKAKVMSGGWPGSQVGSQVGWNVGIEGGGCKNTTTGKPVNVTNWGALGISNSCSNADSSATYGAGFTTTTCTYTNVDPDGSGPSGNINMECKHIGGNFTDATGPTSTPLTLSTGQYLSQPTTLLAQGQTCSSIGSATATAVLSAYRCYADAYQQAIGNASGSCKRDYRFNWSATSAADFAKDSDRGQPNNAFVTNVLQYSADGLSATLEDEKEETFTIETSPSSSSFCKVSRRVIISIKKISDARMLFDLKEGGQMLSTEAGCVGAAKDALASTTNGPLTHLKETLTAKKMIFYMDSSL